MARVLDGPHRLLVAIKEVVHEALFLRHGRLAGIVRLGPVVPPPPAATSAVAAAPSVHRIRTVGVGAAIEAAPVGVL